MGTTLNFRGRGKIKNTARDIYKRTLDFEFERDRSIGLGSMIGDVQTHRQTDTQTDRHTDRQTHRQTDTQTDRQTDRHTDIQTDAHTDRQTDTQTHRGREIEMEIDR